jgi:hypothetical protein
MYETDEIQTHMQNLVPNMMGGKSPMSMKQI